MLRGRETTAASSVLSVTERLNELLTDQSVVLKGVEEQVSGVVEALRSTISFLGDAEPTPADEDYDKINRLDAEVEVLAYETEDLLENFVVETTSKRAGGKAVAADAIKRCAYFRGERRKIQETKSKIENIISKITRIRIITDDQILKGKWMSSSSSSSRGNKEDQYLAVGEHHLIVGFDHHVERLVSLLVDDESEGQVFCIQGESGVGKTSLAKMVYRHKAIRDHFDGHAWVYVSKQQYYKQERKIWEKILDSLGYVGEAAVAGSSNSKHDDVDIGDLADKLYNFLKDNKFLVVLDDVRDFDSWETIAAAFPSKGETRSKILLTAEMILVHAYEYYLEKLTQPESLELFRRLLTMVRGEEIDQSMLELGREMINYCTDSWYQGWLPLDIVVLVGILAKKRSLADWKMVEATLEARKYGDSVVELGYDDLPYYLKPCFLYLSHFPEGYEIPASRLIQLWISEGIVVQQQHNEDGGQLELIEEDVAESYLMELAERRLIQVGELDASFKIKTCYMHGLIRDFCLSKVNQENYFFNIRRVAIHEHFDIERHIDSHLRSLLFFSEIVPEELIDSLLGQSAELFLRENKAWVSTAWRLCQVMRKIRRKLRHMFNNFKLLRVLEFEGADMYIEGGFLKDIDNLMFLKYLSLKNTTCVTKLPSSLGNLRWLQTLDLRMNEEFLIHVPDVMWKLERLRHLYLPDQCSYKTKLKLSNLRNLQMLVNFNTWNCYLGDLQSLTNLRELSISRYLEVQDDDEIEENLNIRSLFIGGHERIDSQHITRLLRKCEICELGLYVEIGKLPVYLPPSIAYMYLRDSKLDADPMPQLEKLPNLRVLELQNAFNGKKIVCSAGGFPQLESLKLVAITNLQEWQKEKGAMPKLREDSLQIINCKRLKVTSAAQEQEKSGMDGRHY